MALMAYFLVFLSIWKKDKYIQILSYIYEVYLENIDAMYKSEIIRFKVH